MFKKLLQIRKGLWHKIEMKLAKMVTQQDESRKTPKIGYKTRFFFKRAQDLELLIQVP